jgi:ribosomal protein L40E
LGPEDHDDLDRARNDVLEDMRGHEFERAMRRAEEFKARLQNRRQDSGDPLRKKAEGLMGFAQFVLNRYGWALDVAKRSQLEELIEQTRAALAGGDRAALDRKVAELDRATDHFPQLAQMLLNMFMAIQSRLSRADPVQAASLLGELEEVEAALKTNDPQAQNKLNRFAAKLAVATDQAGPITDDLTKKTQKCSVCGAEFPTGAAKCPKCGFDPKTLHGGTTKGGY